MGKGKVISIRLSEAEYEKLQRDASAAKMDNSKYLRALISDNTPKEDNSKQELARQFCHIYKVISEEHLENNESLMEEIELLCRILY